jgi:hypothetical protein
MPTAGELSYVLKGLSFQDKQVTHIMNSYNDIERIEDLFLEFNDDKPGLKDELKKLVDNKNFSDWDIRRLVLLMDWYDQQVRKPDFDWKQSNHSDFIGFKRQTKVDKQNSKASSADTTNISTASTDTSTNSTLDFSADIFRKDATGVANCANTGPTDSLKPHPLWKSPFSTAVCKHVSTRTFDDTALSLFCQMTLPPS